MIVRNIGEYLKTKGITPSSCEQKIGVSNGTLSKPLKQNTTIKTNTLEKFLNSYTDINPTWLFTGKGDMLIKSEEETKVYSLRTDHNINDQSIPLYNLEATAGVVSLFNDSNDVEPIDYLQIPNLPKCDGALFVTGDSMYPLLKSGDIVAYKQINDFKNEIFWGEMYLVSVEVAGDTYTMVKYVQKSEEGKDFIKLVSQNNHHQPKDIHLSKLRAMALVKASVRYNFMK